MVFGLIPVTVRFAFFAERTEERGFWDLKHSAKSDDEFWKEVSSVTKESQEALLGID